MKSFCLTILKKKIFTIEIVDGREAPKTIRLVYTLLCQKNLFYLNYISNFQISNFWFFF